MTTTTHTTTRGEPKRLPVWQRVLIAMRNEVVGIHPRLHAYNVAAGLLPPRASGLLRARLLRLVGFQLGAGTQVHGALKISGPRGLPEQLQIGRNCNLEPDCVLELSDKLSIGDGVTLEPGVMILTSTHELDFPSHRAGKLILGPVVIGDGAWLRARCIVLPGITIGPGAVIETGAVVNKNVEPNTRVGGIPAAKLEVLQTT
ncbi:MAG TPA: acyltransferase [Polyangiaceae bacterium]|nr:acyltransferase [Polyangiaceae bacterium]